MAVTAEHISKWSFTGNGVFSVTVKNSREGGTTVNKQGCEKYDIFN